MRSELKNINDETHIINNNGNSDNFTWFLFVNKGILKQQQQYELSQQYLSQWTRTD